MLGDPGDAGGFPEVWGATPVCPLSPQVTVPGGDTR